MNGEKGFFTGQSCADGERAFDLQSVLTHEFGHVLGMDESMHSPEDTMWPRVAACNTDHRTITHDDAEGARAIYELSAMDGTSASDVLGCQAAGVGMKSDAEHVGTLFVVLVLASMIARRKRGHASWLRQRRRR